MIPPVTQIIAGGPVEEQFARLGVEAAKTYDGKHPYFDSRWSVWELDKPNFARLLLDGQTPGAAAAWNEVGAWWRECGGSNVGPCNSETRINGHRILCWNCRPDEDEDEFTPLTWQEWPHVFAYLCDHVGASTERNVAACLYDLAKANGKSVGALLATLEASP